MSTNTGPKIQAVYGQPEFVARTPCDEYCDPDCVHHVPSTGWDLSFGSRLNFHPAAVDDDRLVMDLNLSDDAITNRGVYRQVTPGQLADHAHGILALIGAEPASTAGLYPMRVDLAEVRARGQEAARHLQTVDGVLPAVFGAHLSGDVGAMMQEIEYLRARLGEVRDERIDPRLLRWCDWPGCWRSYDATTGPVGEPGWIAHRRPATLLCPTHDLAGHRPGYDKWEMTDYLVARCECGRSAEVRPANHEAVAEWWTTHVQEATR